MWYLSKTIRIAGAHNLREYKGACANLHGHNWEIAVYCKGEELNEQGMIIDFKKIKEIVNRLDHKHINAVHPFDKINPTAENIAKYFQNTIPYCYKVSVKEEDGSICWYEED